MKIGIVVVNYNKKELLKNCLKSLERVTYKNNQIFVVDNGSSDGSADLIKKEFPMVVCLEMGYNSGFCKANNIGIYASFSAGCEGVVLLNNDTEVTPNFLEEMVRLLDEEKNIGMVAAKIIFLKRKNIIDSCGLQITPDGLAKNRGFECEASLFEKKDEVFCPAGAAALYTKKLLKDIEFENQFLDESYEYYFEELDLGWRARLRGWRCFYAPSAVVYHLKSATSGQYSKMVAYFTNRNIIFNIIKNYPTSFLIKAIPLFLLKYPILLVGIITGVGNGEKIFKKIGLWNTVSAIAAGFHSVMILFFRLIKKRKEIQDRKKVSTFEIARWFSELGVGFFDSVYK